MLLEGVFPWWRMGKVLCLDTKLPQGSRGQTKPTRLFFQEPQFCWKLKSLRASGIQHHHVWVLEHLSGGASGLVVRVTEYLGLAKWILHRVSFLW